MGYLEKRNKVDELKIKIDAQGEILPEIKKKINYKFRLDWNYYSNSMEGNTLTIEETRSIMVGNITIGGKPMKDVLEIKGHDKVVSDILKIGKGEVRLSEKRIRDIHTAIMHEEDEAKKSKIGVWKTEPNYIINYKGERHDFALPSEVSAKMHHLLNNTNAHIDAVINQKEDALHPLDIALQFHLDYVAIHPFYDGNGRTARILTNLLLISFGYPPFWIKENERRIYYQYLADIQSYGGSSELFYEFIMDTLLRSLNIISDALEGKNIEEPEDLDKKISLLEKNLESIDSNNEIKLQLSHDVFLKIYKSWLQDLLFTSIPLVQKFNRFFTNSNHYVSISSNTAYVQFVNDSPSNIIEQIDEQIGKNLSKSRLNLDFTVSLSTFYGTFIKGGINTFGCNYGFQIEFDLNKYRVLVDIFSEEEQREKIVISEKLLHEPLTPFEIQKVISVLGNSIYDHISYYTKKNGIL